MGLVAVLGGATVVGACGNPPRSADEALASAQAYVTDVSAFEFDAATRTTYVMDAPDQMDGDTGSDSELVVEGDAALEPEWPTEPPGSTTTDRATITGSWTSDAWESRIEDGFGLTEVKVFGSTSYVRFDMDDGPADWEMYEVPEMSRQEMVDELEAMRQDLEAEDDVDGYAASSGASTGLAAAIYLGGDAWGGSDLSDDPAGYLRAIQDLSDPTLDSRDGELVTISAEVTAPADIEEAWGAPIPPGRMRLTVAGDGAPTGLTLSVSEGEDSVEVEVRFSDWNVPRELARPDQGEIDRTPWIDEEAIAAVAGVTLLRPGLVPESWVLDYVDVLTGEDSPEGCDQVELHWSPMLPADPEAEYPDDYLDLYLLPVGCALEDDPTPFVVGPFAPLPSRGDADFVEVLVGDTVVQVDSSMTGSELAALVTSLAPTDLDALVAEMAVSHSSLQTS